MPSGRFSVRVPKQLHEELVAQAKKEGVSLNVYINLLLTVGVTSGQVLEKFWDPKVTVTRITEDLRDLPEKDS